MEFFSEVTYYTYQATSMFSLVTTTRADIMAMGNPSKERDTWKGKWEDIERKFSMFQEDTTAL